MTTNELSVLRALLRQDLPSFVAKSFHTVGAGEQFLSNWHIDLIADRLASCRRREITRLAINLPPRSLKSLCVSIAFPAWLLGHDPSCKVICASYSGELAQKLARDCRTVMTSDWYLDTFSATRIDRRKNRAEEFETTAGGFRLATSVGGTLTGRGGDVIIVDDPQKPQEALSPAQRQSVKQWFDSTLYSRLDNKSDGAIILVMQRVHIDDLTTHVLAKGGWQLLSLPARAEVEERHVLSDGRVFARSAGQALHEAREPDHSLKDIERTLGSFHFASQYQQSPVNERGNMLRWTWFRLYDDMPAATKADDHIVQSWDTAMTAHDGSDWSVCSTWAIRGGDYYLIDIYRDRHDFPSLKQKVVELRMQFNAHHVLIEDAGSGTALIQQLSQEGAFRPIAIKPKGSKADRMAAQSSYIEAGHVHVPKAAPWLEDLRVELLAFPHGRHDDQVDSISQFLNWLQERRQRRVRSGRAVGLV